MAICGAALLTLVAASGCGSDDDDDGGSSGGNLTNCKALCDSQSECNTIVTVDDCKQLCDAFAQAPADCQSALEASSSCQNDDSPCDPTGCEDQVMAVNTACQ